MLSPSHPTTARTLLLVLILIPGAMLAQDAGAAIVRLFDQHAVVMLGEMHESFQQHALVNKLVAMPEFAERVNNIVVESALTTSGSLRHRRRCLKFPAPDSPGQAVVVCAFSRIAVTRNSGVPTPFSLSR